MGCGQDERVHHGSRGDGHRDGGRSGALERVEAALEIAGGKVKRRERLFERLLKERARLVADLERPAHVVRLDRVCSSSSSSRGSLGSLGSLGGESSSPPRLVEGGGSVATTGEGAGGGGVENERGGIGGGALVHVTVGITSALIEGAWGATDGACSVTAGACGATEDGITGGA